MSFKRFLAVGMAAALFAQPALPFGTINAIGQAGEHEQITRQALSYSFQPLTMDQLAGKIGSFGAVGAPDMPNRILTGHYKEHCDDGDYLESLDKQIGYPQTRAEAQAILEECREYIFQRLLDAVRVSAPLDHPDDVNTALDCNFREVFANRNAGSVKCNVLKLFGEALHASEDFYSHTNWVDQSDPGRGISTANPPGLGHSGRAPWLDPRQKASFPEGLISGCFELKELVNAEASCLFPDPRAKGSGTPQMFDRVKHANLNKDRGDISPVAGNRSAVTTENSPPRALIADNFAKAVSAAVEDAADKWNYMKDRIIQTYGAPSGLMIICVLEVDDYHQCLKKKDTFRRKPLVDNPPIIESVPPPPFPPCFNGLSDRSRWMNAFYNPWRSAVAANLGKALVHSAELETAFHTAEHDIGPDSAAARDAYALWKGYDPQVDIWRKALADVDAARAEIEKIPTNGCPERTVTEGGGTTSGTGGDRTGGGPTDTTPPPLPPGFARPTLERVNTPPPKAFCDEKARTDYIVEVFDPELAKASHNAVIASGHTKALSIGIGEAMRANDHGASEAALRREYQDWEKIRVATFDLRDKLMAMRQAVLNQPLVPCGVKEAVPPPPPPPPPPTDRHAGVCVEKKPIVVGSNGAVGSGARNRDKLISTGIGLVGGLLGGRVPGGGGGGDDGPQLATCRIGPKEMTVFQDPASGVSLAVGAKRSGDTVVVFGEVTRSPDAGTFQTGYLQNGEGARQAPNDVNICELWGEWKLTVSWTRTTYVNNQMVSRESGGWSKSGEFHLPGTVSTEAAPDGLWKRLGFSNASHGARKIALQYRLPRQASGETEPVAVVIHVTRPGRNPVDTAPFALRMREGPKGFTFEPIDDTCP